MRRGNYSTKHSRTHKSKLNFAFRAHSHRIVHCGTVCRFLLRCGHVTTWLVCFLSACLSTVRLLALFAGYVIGHCSVTSGCVAAKVDSRSTFLLDTAAFFWQNPLQHALPQQKHTTPIKMNEFQCVFAAIPDIIRWVFEPKVFKNPRIFIIQYVVNSLIPSHDLQND